MHPDIPLISPEYLRIPFAIDAGLIITTPARRLYGTLVAIVNNERSSSNSTYGNQHPSTLLFLYRTVLDRKLDEWITTGQGEGRVLLIAVDPDWLLEREQQADFTAAAEAWHTFGCRGAAVEPQAGPDGEPALALRPAAPPWESVTVWNMPCAACFPGLGVAGVVGATQRRAQMARPRPLRGVAAVQETSGILPLIVLEQQRQGLLVVCDVVHAELTPAFGTETELNGALGKLDDTFEPFAPAAGSRRDQRHRRCVRQLAAGQPGAGGSAALPRV